jgi:hypothetical protein
MKGRMCDPWIGSIQKRSDVSALRIEDGHVKVKWTWCVDISVSIRRRYVQTASTQDRSKLRIRQEIHGSDTIT